MSVLDLNAISCNKTYSWIIKKQCGSIVGKICGSKAETSHFAILVFLKVNKSLFLV